MSASAKDGKGACSRHRHSRSKKHSNFPFLNEPNINTEKDFWESLDNIYRELASLAKMKEHDDVLCDETTTLEALDHLPLWWFSGQQSPKQSNTRGQCPDNCSTKKTKKKGPIDQNLLNQFSTVIDALQSIKGGDFLDDQSDASSDENRNLEDLIITPLMNLISKHSKGSDSSCCDTSACSLEDEETCTEDPLSDLLSSALCDCDEEHEDISQVQKRPLKKPSKPKSYYKHSRSKSHRNASSSS